MQLRDGNKWDRQPRILTDEEIATPMKVIHEVFDYADLPDLRNTLWEWLKTTVSGNFNKPSLHYKDRESLLAFYERIQKLLEAAHLLLLTSRLQNVEPKPVLDSSFQAGNVQKHEHELIPATELVPISEKIFSLLSPDMIFEVGKAQELPSALPVFHFLIVLPNTFNSSYAACQTLVENACPNIGTIRLITVKRNELERQMSEGHLLYASLCQEERVIFANECQTIPSLNRKLLPERIDKARTELVTILHKAEAFYEGAFFYLQRQNEALAVFHFQQAIEHCLRGFLSVVTGRNHVTHDLIFLRHHALPFFPALEHLLPVEADSTVCLLHQVSKAYTQARYENNFSMPVPEINRLKRWVEIVLPHTKQAFETWVSTYAESID